MTEGDDKPSTGSGSEATEFASDREPLAAGPEAGPSETAQNESPPSAPALAESQQPAPPEGQAAPSEAASSDSPKPAPFQNVENLLPTEPSHSEPPPEPERPVPDESSAPEPAFTAAPDSGEVAEVEPELIEVPKKKVPLHHPPPPPSLRTTRDGEPGALQPDPRFAVTGQPRLARDLMSRRLFTIEPDDTIDHLEEHMKAFRFRHLPVVEGAKVVGLITHRDLLHASSSFLSERAKERDEIIHKVQAKRIMRRELITVRPTTSLHETAVLMWEAKIGCVLVTEEDNTLLGIVTEADFVRLAHHFLLEAQKEST